MTDAPPSLSLRAATPDDAEAIAGLRNTSADDLTARHGRGAWSGHGTRRGVLAGFRDARVLVAYAERDAVASLRLATRKPWSIDPRRFTPVPRRLYLTNMVILPEFQRRGLGRACLAEALRVARAWPTDAVALDAFDDRAGAGDFYRRCGFTERGRGAYRGAKLIYFEMLL